jgi:hypothetical protein
VLQYHGHYIGCLPNPQKAYPMDNTAIGKENGTSEVFVGFLMYLIAECFFSQQIAYDG